MDKPPANQLRDMSIHISEDEFNKIFEGLVIGHKFAAGVYIRASVNERNKERGVLQTAINITEKLKEKYELD